MTLPRPLKWIAGALLAALAAAIFFIAVFGWNWLRGPLERMALERTGRVLAIGGDIGIEFGWPRPRLHAGTVSFANPAWAREAQMLTADALEVTIDLPQLLRRNIVFPELRLARPILFLEKGSGGRKTWLLDINQQDEDARIRVDRLRLDHGSIGYDDAGQQTSIRAELSSADPAPGAPPGDAGVRFSARGQYLGQPFAAQGTGGPVLALRDERTPYPLHVELTVGRTGVKADGTVTSLLKFSAVDMRLALRGDSLAQLFPLLGIAFPETRPYTTEGQLRHEGKTWRYEKFSGRVGASDIAGSLQLDTGGKRPAMTAEVVSTVLDIADLGPLIGARAGRSPAAKQAPTATPAPARLLPDRPFNSERWNSVDAEVTVSATTLRGAGTLPLADLVTHLSMRDSVLRLDPLQFGVAGGHVDAVISLDGRQDPIAARARVRAKQIQVARLLPGVGLSKTSIGQVHGEFDLAGTGNSVGRMLATANGKLGLVVAGGKISQLTMERAGLHLWEILELKMSGDRRIKLRCAVADFAVKGGSMHAEALILDTEVTTIVGTGSIDLGQEKLDLTLDQKTKNTSPVALRSPIYIRGSFARPAVQVDKGRVAARALGAIGLAIVNPILTLIPLIDAGPGRDSDCGQLVGAARVLPPLDAKKMGPRK